MKTIGLLGGMSWESTEHYYRVINEETKQALGSLHSAKIILISVDFQEIEQLQSQGDWEQAASILSAHAKKIETAGADMLLICTNTMHKVAEQIEQAINIPLIHIADATAQSIKESGITTVGLLGTRFTMEQQFYKQRLINHGLKVLIPDQVQRDAVHQIIYEELCQGLIKTSSRAKFIDVIDSLTSAGAEAVIEGCTEIGLLIKQKDTKTVLFDTTKIHAKAAVTFALAD